LHKVSWIYTVVFYAVTMFTFHLVTATKRTADARLPLFALLTVNLLLERWGG
jgi:hypothetical protein